MAYKSVENSSLTSLANKIREKAKTSDPLSVPEGMISGINSIVNASESNLFKVSFGGINSSNSRKSLSITGLGFEPSGAIFICTYVLTTGSDVLCITSKQNGKSQYGFCGRLGQYARIQTNFITFGVDSVTIANPIAYSGSTKVTATLSGAYNYVIWGK